MPTLDDWLALAPQAPALTGDHKWHVFLSYRSVHRPWVIHLYDVLRQMKFEVFLDQYVLAASDTLVGKLGEGLEKSASSVLMWSTATQDSEWCKKECESMEAKTTGNPGFHYVVSTLDKVELPFWARQRIYIDFAECREGPRGTGLLRLMYGILGQPLPDAAVRLATSVDEMTGQALIKIRGSLATGDYERLLQLSGSDDLAWVTTPLLSCNVTEALIKLERYDDALRVLEGVQARFPKAVRPAQLKGLALARKGDWRSAQQILGDLEAAGEQDPETLGIYARTWADRYQESNMLNHLRRSRDLYARAFAQAPRDYYTGINAAAKSVFLGEPELAEDFAAKVEAIVGTARTEGDYWKSATAAEVQLIKRNYAGAAKLYRDAVDMEPESLGSHRTTWVQAQRLMRALQPSPEDLQKVASVFVHLQPPAAV
jgi:hypothetical protein